MMGAVGMTVSHVHVSGGLLDDARRLLKRNWVAISLTAVLAAAVVDPAGVVQTSADSSRAEIDEAAALIAAVAPSQGVLVQPLVVANGSFRAAMPVGEMAMPATLQDPLVLNPKTASGPVRVSLPGGPGVARIASDGTVVYPGVAAATAVQVLQSGVRVQTLLNTPEAPRSYSYDFGPSVVPVLTGAGGVELRRQAGDVVESLGHLEPAWARDADGRAVPTWYAVDGHVVVQHIAPSSTHRYPIVADPFWIPVLAVMARFTAHALQSMAARKVSQELVKQVVLNGKRTRGNRPNTSVFTQGSGSGRIRVLVDDRTGNIITVTKG